MTTDYFISRPYNTTPDQGTIHCQSPSNIALVKYWGKYGMQFPKNASISFTLKNCHTNTTLHFKKKQLSKDFDFKIYLDHKRELSFETKIETFFNRIHKYLPFLKEYTFKIETSNSFPHSSGIASSASGMSALAFCLVEMEKKFYSNECKINESFFLQKTSFLARLGSGSASRSIEGPIVVWGKHSSIERSTSLFGTKYPYKVHPIFKNYQNTILLVDKGEKQVSSSLGHSLMRGHPYAEQRFLVAHKNIDQLIPIFKNGDLNAFIKIVESEALQLHGMMMTSSPYFILMKPNTLEIINCIWKYREQTKSKVCFTLDAGANVHVLYPEGEKESVLLFIKNTLAPFCKEGEFIEDQLGMGAMLS